MSTPQQKLSELAKISRVEKSLVEHFMSKRKGRHIENAVLEIEKILDSCDAEVYSKEEVRGCLFTIKQEASSGGVYFMYQNPLITDVQRHIEGWNIQSLQKIPKVLNELDNFFKRDDCTTLSEKLCELNIQLKSHSSMIYELQLKLLDGQNDAAINAKKNAVNIENMLIDQNNEISILAENK